MFFNAVLVSIFYIVIAALVVDTVILSSCIQLICDMLVL